MNAGSGDPDPRTLDAGPVTLQCVIRGRVQGVFFRVSTRDRAQALGLTGWVRNLADGSVEAFFQGARPHCERALEFVNRGPDAARVDSVGATWGNAFDPTLTSFEIR